MHIGVMHQGLPWADDGSAKSAPKGSRAPSCTRISSSYSSMTSSYSCSSMSTNSTNPVHAGHGSRYPAAPSAEPLHGRGKRVKERQQPCSNDTQEQGASPWPSAHLAGHGGPPRGKFSLLPHRRKEAHRDDSNRKLTTQAIWAHGELERDGLHRTNLRATVFGLKVMMARAKD